MVHNVRPAGHIRPATSRRVARVTRFLFCYSETVSGHFLWTSPNISLPLDIPPGQFPRTLPTPLISNQLLKLILCLLVKLGEGRLGPRFGLVSSIENVHHSLTSWLRILSKYNFSFSNILFTYQVWIGLIQLPSF